MFGSKNKKTICFLAIAALILAVGLQPALRVNAAATIARNTVAGSNRDAQDDKYSEDWLYWLQGASRYNKMANYGCHVVAYSKLIMEVGCPVSRKFDPDMMLYWAQNSRVNGKPYIYDSIAESNIAGVGKLPCEYAKARGFELSLEKTVDISGYTEAQKPDVIMSYLKQGYYIVLGHSTHLTYVARNLSLEKDAVYVSDSTSKYSYNAAWLHDYRTYSSVWRDYPHYDKMFLYRAQNVPIVTPTPKPEPVNFETLKLGTDKNNTSDKARINIGETLNLGFYGAKGYNKDTDAASAKWTSTNPKVATVSSNGIVKAVSYGNCEIRFSILIHSTLTQYDGKMSITVAYPATPTPTPAEPVSLYLGFADGSQDINLYEGDTFDLNSFPIADVVSGNGAVDVSWSVPYEDVVSIGSDNILTAHKYGVCSVTCHAVDRSDGTQYEGKIWVNVFKLTPDIQLSRMDSFDEMARFLMENPGVGINITPDYTYNSKMDLLLNATSDIENMKGRDSVIVAVPAGWSASDFEEVLGSESFAEYSEQAMKLIRNGYITVKKDDDYYYLMFEQ